jgi:hypothetical protein
MESLHGSYVMKNNMEGFLNDVKLPDFNLVEKEDAAFIDTIVERLGIDSSVTERTFKNKDFFNALPQAWKDDPEVFGQYIHHTITFAALVEDARKARASGDITGLLGEEISLPPSSHADGRERRAEKGCRINTDYLVSKGIDPSKVLFFRITQPSAHAKPELYWTSDLSEVGSGLTAEIPQEQRNTSIILVCDLETLEREGGGLIQDMNDDGGISVRTIEPVPFDQNNALFKIGKLTYLIYE